MQDPTFHDLKKNFFMRHLAVMGRDTLLAEVNYRFTTSSLRLVIIQLVHNCLIVLSVQFLVQEIVGRVSKTPSSTRAST